MSDYYADLLLAEEEKMNNLYEAGRQDFANDLLNELAIRKANYAESFRGEPVDEIGNCVLLAMNTFEFMIRRRLGVKGENSE